MWDELSDLSKYIIASKVRSLTEDIYSAVESLPIDEFGVFVSVLIEMWCKNYGIDALEFLDIMETSMLENVEKDMDTED